MGVLTRGGPAYFVGGMDRQRPLEKLREFGLALLEELPCLPWVLLDEVGAVERGHDVLACYTSGGRAIQSPSPNNVSGRHPAEPFSVDPPRCTRA